MQQIGRETSEIKKHLLLSPGLNQKMSPNAANTNNISPPDAPVTESSGAPYFHSGAFMGMRVFSIREGDPCHSAGLRNGDIITSVDGDALDPEALAGQLAEICAGQKGFRLEITRPGLPKRLIISPFN